MAGAQTVNDAGMTWLAFALATVLFWGVYGVLLHTGQLAMSDSANGRYKAFLFVGLAYFLTAVLAPLLLLWLRGADWSFPVRGMGWSLVAGIAGAAGAFCILLAYGARGAPGAVMSIVFAGAPIVNAVVALWLHPPTGGWSAVRWPFYAGIVLAATGGYLVTVYRPPSAPAPARPVAPLHETPPAGAR